MMNVLDEMGIQSWRLRARTGESENQQAILTEVVEPLTDGVQPSADDVEPLAEDVEPLAEDVESLTGSVESPDGHRQDAPTDTVIDDSTIDQNTEAADSDTESSNSSVPPKLEVSDWQGLVELMSSSTLCASCAASNPYLGEGDISADWLFVIDAPSHREIQAQQLIDGRAGQLFEGILAAIGQTRSTIYLASVFKCPPSEDLSLSPQCDSILQRQIALVQPRVVVTFGEFAAQAVIKANESLEILRSTDQRCFSNNIAIVPTHSPSEMLDDPRLKARVWLDLKKALSLAQH